MAAKDLITLAQATQNLQSVGTLTSAQNAIVSSLITAVSDAIEKYCRRDFVQKTYDELYNGNGDNRLLLRQYPIISVQSVRYRPVTVLKVINNSTAIQQARVSVTQVGLTLWWMASGVQSADTTSLYASFPTLQAIANNINAIGSGWQAVVTGESTSGGDYYLWPSADLFVMPSYQNQTPISQSQGALTARQVYAELKMHTYELAGYQFDPRGWLLRAIPYTDPELLHPEDLVWSPGINNFRVQYTAGYNYIPEAVQQAAGQWVAELYYRTLRDPSLSAQTLTSQTWGSSAANTMGKPPFNVQVLLAPYRRHTVANNQG